MSIAQELIAVHPVRKSGRQKRAFIGYVQNLCRQHGWSCAIETGGIAPKSRNIVIGDLETAQIVVTAHYDTCAALPLPNFITPRNPLCFLLYQLLLCAALFIPPIALAALLGRWLNQPMVTAFLCPLFTLLICVQMICGFANPHTANDNTSGTAVVLELMASLPEDSRANAALVLFDNEELGLFGSAFFHRKHRRQMANKLLVNLDCVSDGTHWMLCAKKAARQNPRYAILAQAFEKNAQAAGKTPVCCAAAWTVYPSDQMQFPQGVAVCALKKAPLIGLYMDRIHTPFDTVYDPVHLNGLKGWLLQVICSIEQQAARCKNEPAFCPDAPRPVSTPE